MTAPDSAPERLSEVEWRIYLDEPTAISCVGYRALNELLVGVLKGKWTKIQYRAIDGKWYSVRTGKQKS